jgi:hypothetical protein
LKNVANILKNENQNWSCQSYSQNQVGTGQVNQRQHGHFGLDSSDEALVNVRSIIFAIFFQNTVLPETLQPEQTLKERVRVLEEQLFVIKNVQQSEKWLITENR